MCAASEKVRLIASDVETLRLHYAYTLREWLARATANRAKIEALYDARFFRMWEYYLAAVEVGFRHGSQMVFQLLLSTRVDAVPILRDFMLDDARTAAAVPAAD